MASQIYFGRAGLPTASGGDGLTLYRGAWEGEGDEQSVDLLVRDLTAADAKALRDQLNGYHLNTDEPVIPIVDNVDTSRSGFYRVQRIRQVPEVTGKEGSGTKLTYRLTAELLKVPGFQSPLFEYPLTGNVRVNSHSVVIGTTIPTYSSGVGSYAVDSPEYGTATTVTGADGAVVVSRVSSPTTYVTSPGYAVAAADYYKGCCRVEVSYDSGSTWRTVTGLQVANLPTRVRVSNSLVRVTTTTTSAVTELSVEWHDATQWETAKVFRLTLGTSYDDLAMAPAGLTIHHNRPEGAGIRLELAQSGGTGRAYLDVTLRRGSRVVYGYLGRGGTVPGADYGIKLTTTEAATDITGGIRATNNDAGGNKVVIATPQTLADTDNSNGRIRVNQDDFRFALACAIGGTVGNGFNETQGLVYEYLAAVNGRQSVVAR